MTVKEESSLATDEVLTGDIVHECEWYKYDNVDHIPLNGKVHTKKWGIQLYSREIQYQNSDIQHNIYSPLDYFLISFPNERMKIYV